MKFETFENTVGEYEKEVERIQLELEKYLNKDDAQKTTREIYDMVLDIDENLNELLSDPKVLENYYYDGYIFESKNKSVEIHNAPNGLVILKSLDGGILDKLREDKVVATKALFEWIKKYADRSKFLLTRWREDKTLRMFNPKEIKEIAKEAERSKVTSLSNEEQEFFKFYEEQLKGKNAENGEDGEDGIK
ncbi:MAG: hypothetical protein COV29_00865 [Candidatus Yanofskybacteria bacterium CG10_big_fil_rev_8_21_14_0_10_36_16]|uniref:Uncharacterized protein n=1 Tax=Candidatus Yanofskybacteria bacterium CG10_big_fil_rev_8_21_14_0_10_36_16 TaxID=1975096 RepID=A0A2J0QBP6_9BACT|nr:MAG: hypothetical protein COV29_00865 [Candidatus Yanofskybacteria bacterium CG10_big_fil_rev_8_21_14_0_10_36_16]